MKKQQLNAKYRLKVTSANDASSSEEIMFLHIQYLNEMQMRVSTMDKTGHGKGTTVE
jgi:hypothetical protein